MTVLPSSAPFQIGNSWSEVLADELEKPYLRALADFLRSEIANGELIYPPPPLIFNAFEQTPFEEVKVVIMGQDPYHGAGQAEGLSFSVGEGVRIPPSLRNIYKELEDDLGVAPSDHGSLLRWAKQGVLMLNATLTVRAKQPKSHYGKGWEQFTDAVIARLVAREDPVIFVLWGRSAKEKVTHIAHNYPYLITSPHPSPYSADSGFFGSRPFSKVNALLEKMGKSAIDW